MTIAIRSSSRVRHERRSRMFFWSRLKKLSMAALSPAAPTRPIDPTMLWCPRARTNFRERNYGPAVRVQDAAGNVLAPGDGVVERRDRLS